MRGCKRVVDVDLAEGGKAACELWVVGLLLRMEPDVLEEQHVAGPQPAHCASRRLTYTVLGELDLAAELFCERCRDGPQRKRGLDTLRPSQVGHDDHLGAPLREVLEGWDRGSNARVIRDAVLGERHVEVLAHEDTFGCDID